MKSAAYTFQLEEIIFSNKNRAYGAYALRNIYHRNLAFTSLLVITIFTAAFTIPRYFKEKTITVNTGTRVVEFDRNLLLPIKSENNIKQPVQAPKTNIVRYTVPVVTEDFRVPDEQLMPTVAELHQANPGTANIAGSPDGIDVIPEDITHGTETAAATAPEQPFLWAEEMPRYAEGDAALMAFLSARIKYPELARRVGISGRVIISFVVNKDGSIVNPEIVKGIGAGCDEEAIRVISLMNKWLPGKQNGKPVRVKMSLPIVFRLS